MNLDSVKSTDASFINRFFIESLREAKAYKIDVKDCPIKIDQNECPYDWPEDFKKKVCERLIQENWNRYPPAFDDELNQLIASYASVPAENVLTGPGSNQLITVLLSTLSRNEKSHFVIARPSFALYEMHCKYEGIPYEVWPLDDNLEYNQTLLPKLTKDSVVVFASPNNPVGNQLSYDNFDELLTQNPEALFLADEAYFEFIDKPYTRLLEKHANLILIRTFSKTMGAAALRIGYLIASTPIIEQLKKVRLPFLLNSFSLVAAKELLSSAEMKAFRDKTVQETLKERDEMFLKINSLSPKNLLVKEPHANFLLLKFSSQELCQKSYASLTEAGVLIRNVSMGPGLSGCLRATIGLPEENEKLWQTLQSLFK